MSTQITTELVKELRDKTGISIMQCRKALEEASGDMEKAILILKKNSGDIALKKADRDASDGAICVKTNGDKTILLTLHCETDFVSKNDDFVKVLNELTQMALEHGVEKMKESSKELIDGIIQKTGEKVELGEVSLINGSTVGSYVHNGKNAVIVSLEGGNVEIARDIAMHAAAMRPEYITNAEITEEAKKAMTDLYTEELANVDKPEEIKKKMLEGKLNTFFKEKTLTEQPFIKNPDETVGQLLAKNNAKIIEVKRSVI
jgi:elongation factor Ts